MTQPHYVPLLLWTGRIERVLVVPPEPPAYVNAPYMPERIDWKMIAEEWRNRKP